MPDVLMSLDRWSTSKAGADRVNGRHHELALLMS